MTADSLLFAASLPEAFNLAGLGYPGNVDPGKFIRFSTNEKDRADRAGWLNVFADGLGASFGDWRSGSSFCWQKRDTDAPPPSRQEREEARQRHEEARKRAEQERVDAYTRAASECASLWAFCEPAPASNDYLQRKEVSPHLARVDHEGRLVLPVFDARGDLQSLQFIGADGAKRFFPGGRMKGGRLYLGHPTDGKPLVLVEGFATGASIFESAGVAVCIGFAGSNLRHVAETLRKLYPNSPLTIAGDLDSHGAGRRYADAAAEAAAPARVILPTFRDGRESGDYNDLCTDEGPDAVRSQLSDKPAKPKGIWPAPINLADLATREPEPPRFIVNDWLPAGYATLLAGHGGIGKSGIALHLAVCLAAGIPFFGEEVERRRVIYLSCEDRENVLHWRLTRICAYLGIDLASLAGWLQIIDLVGHETILWQADRQTGAALTSAFGALADSIDANGAQVLFVDGIADTFGGNENSRSDVKAFVNSLLGLVPPEDGAVVLVGHVAKPAATFAATSEGYSGSTGWHNSVRARWYLHPETTGQDDEAGPAEKSGDLILDLQKSNLGPAGRAMRFTWSESDSLFVGQVEGGQSNFDRKQRDLAEQDAILAAIRACPEPVPAALSGPRTAHHVLSSRPEFPPSLKSGKQAKKRFWRHVEVLRQMGHVTEGSIRRANRHLLAVLTATGKGCADAPNA